MNEDLSADRLRDVLDYDVKTGVFRWKVSTARRIRVGQVAGWDNGCGYLLICIDGQRYMVHRLAWLYTHGVWPAQQLDHRDGNRSNNRLANLREATNAENGRNRGVQSNNTSGYKGVCWCKRDKRWQASIRVNRRLINLGYYDTPEAAHAAYCAGSARLHGDFGRTT